MKISDVRDFLQMLKTGEYDHGDLQLDDGEESVQELLEEVDGNVSRLQAVISQQRGHIEKLSADLAEANTKLQTVSQLPVADVKALAARVEQLEATLERWNP